MFACQEAQVGFTLEAEILKNNQILIILTDDVHLFFTIFLRIFFVFFIIVFVARWQRKTRITLIKIPDPLKLFPEVLLSLTVLKVLDKLMYNASKTPKIGWKVILLLNEGYLRRPIPSRADVQGHVALHRFPPFSVADQLVLNIYALLLLAALKLLDRVLPQV